MAAPPCTPEKHKMVSDGACFSPPPKKWTTPSKGKPKKLKGYVILVGQEQTSQNNNIYFDIMIQLAAKDKGRVRVMKTDAQVNRDVFLQHFVKGTPTKAIHFQSVFQTDDSYFYNGRLGSSHSFSDKSAGFAPCSYADFTAKNVERASSAQIDLHCQIVYINDIHFNPNNGSPYRNVVFQTDEETTFGTIWAEELFHLTENEMLYMTNLKKKITMGHNCTPPHKPW